MCGGYVRKFLLKCNRFTSNISSRTGLLPVVRKSVIVLLIISLCLNLLFYLLQEDTRLFCKQGCGNGDCSNGVEEALENRVIYRAKDGTDIKSKDALLAGKYWKEKVFLTIGLPTIERKGGVDYLETTLNSLLQNASSTEEKNVKIVILLTDDTQSTRTRRLKGITTKYSSYIENGKIQVITVPRKAYPQLRGLVRTLKDTDERMYWRSKQAIDFAFLMEYSRTFSTYYLQLEDDVIAAQYYDIHIREFIKEKEGIYWFNLNFSLLGFIGKLFRSNTLHDVARLFRLLYTEMPIDLLLFRYRKLLGDDRKENTYPHNIFRHIGQTTSAL